MINHRDKGYATLHKIVLLSSLFLWFWICLYIWESFDFSLISLPWNYALVSIAGLVVGTFGSLQRYGLFFMKNGWGRIRESLLKANFQTAIIAFFVLETGIACVKSSLSILSLKLLSIIFIL